MENDTLVSEDPEVPPERPVKSRRLLRLGLAVLSMPTLIGALALGVLYMYLHVTSEQSLLSAWEWQRLRARLARSAEEEILPPPTVASAPALPERDVEPPPLRPSRVSLPLPDPVLLTSQTSEFRSESRKSILELQPFRRTETLEIPGIEGRKGRATLVNVNPTVNSWYLLVLSSPDGREDSYHLVNPHPKTQDLTLDPARPTGVTIVDSVGRRTCELWSDGAPSPLNAAKESRSPYASLCGEELTLRIPTPGRRTTMEWATDFLRDNFSTGESITVFVREKFFQDAFLETSELVPGSEDAPADVGEDAPRPARLDPRYRDMMLVPEELGISLEGVDDDRVTAGSWHHVGFEPGVFLSVVRPNLVAPEIFREHRDIVATLDEVENEALVYLVAFDLAHFDVGFALGTEHPRVDWSGRVLESERPPSLPGPDGIDEMAPFVPTGIVPRSEADRTVATFTGGFKRDHGAFRTSELATRNHGSHYGFIESGAILSKLRPGLATIFVLEDGRLDLKTWTEEDDVLLSRVEFARQNGLAIIERDPETGGSVPGPKITQWAAGNWSGSQDKKFRTVRAGAALQQIDDRRYLIYAYFSAATPSAMARVFQAYGCDYAMLLDMNALEHTYLGLYRVQDQNLSVQHLIRGMEVLDKTVEGQVIPRFLGFADNRDFFYVLRKRT